jgi:hypothetical protein
MRFSTLRTWVTGIAALLLMPAAALAQYRAPEFGDASVAGEKYHVELGGTLWTPNLAGIVSSEQFGQVGTKIDFVGDLGFEKTRFKDLRIVLRPTRKAKFRIQYTPVVYEAQTSLPRSIIFNGQRYDVNMPVQSAFEWKVWRLGYEYDFVYLPRGFVGMLIEGRLTHMKASIATPLLPTEFTEAKAPLPAIGLVGRAYVLPELAVNFEVSGFKLPENAVPDTKANYFDWDINGTFNVTNNVGLQIGWRRMSNYLALEHDLGDVKFQGMWFGAALRY